MSVAPRLCGISHNVRFLAQVLGANAAVEELHIQIIARGEQRCTMIT
jgi:hypothetical protein